MRLPPGRGPRRRIDESAVAVDAVRRTEQQQQRRPEPQRPHCCVGFGGAEAESVDVAPPTSAAVAG